MPTIEDRRDSKSLTAAWDGTGTEPDNTTLTLNHQGMGTVTFQLSGTFSATITFEGTVNGTDWEAVPATRLSNNAKATTATAAGIYLLPGAAFMYMRARQSARVSGTTVVHGRASVADFPAFIASTTSATGAGGSGGTQYAEDAAHTSGDLGFQQLAVRRDAGTPTAADGDYHPALVDLAGSLWVRGGGAKKPSGTLTRPANTTAYTAQDEVGTGGTAPLSITVQRVNAGTGFVVGGRLVYSNSPSTTPQFRALIFGQTVTLAGDNAQINISDADALKYLGLIDFTTSQGMVYSGGTIQTAGALVMGGAPVAPIAFECESGAAVLYVVLITLNAFTPIANSETIAICLDIDRD